jgi:Tfp pilus assembly protein PilE
MGQQQLLLLVLGAIIVGLAIVVGINLFGEGALKANEDAVRQDILTMMARVEEYYRKPVMLGGGGKTLATSLTFGDFGYKSADGTANTTTEYENENAVYTLTPTATTVNISGACKEDDRVTVSYTLTVGTNGNTTIADDNAPT